MSNNLQYIKPKTIGFSIGCFLLFPFVNSVIYDFGFIIYTIPITLLLIVYLLNIINNINYNDKVKYNSLLYLYFVSLLYVYLMLSSVWVRSDVYYIDDINNITFIISITTLIYFTISIQSIDYFIDILIIIGIIAVIVLILSYLNAGNLRGYGVIEEYLVVSQLIGLSSIASFGSFLFRSKNKLINRYYLITSIFLYIGLALSLARGALVFSVMISSLMVIVYLVISKNKVLLYFEKHVHYKINKLWVLLGSISFLSIIIFIATRIERTASRLSRLFSGNELSTGGRGSLWSTSLESISGSPVFGYGLGSHGIMSSPNESYYPHNLFLQVMLDGGFIAFVILFIIVSIPIAAFVIKIRNRKILKSIPLLFCYIFIILELMKSSDFYTSRSFFILGLLCVKSSDTNYKEKIKSIYKY